MGQLSSRLPGADKNARREALKTFKDDLYTGAQVQTSLLCTQCADTLDISLEFLPLSDLLALSCTCKTLYIAVLAYIKHICNKSGLEEAYSKFLDKNKELLTLVEQGAGVLGELQGLDMGKSVEELTSSERRQLWFLAKWKEFYYLETRRISVTNESVDFPHKGTHFIPIQQEQTYLQSTQQLKTKEG
ncbi:uncharacterized protein LOC111702484 isoform X2 [Eurytemora carolleeae]|uniref:uncharacterized protein LOC111702484 isoform X2 n=1 Tax=Eurytemora carolleeae TaxID=1294199 RepID=UPI000C77331C|nr:uncharacterized protein LOC111702484 isoform X2 [Eurytemora carolleeae]|eukprot:XP_023329960.1 uncharacterized protein LOC111702484 isoform X2 [Eurytemora affinis]